MWSAGVVLFTLVNGHLPFEDSNTQSLYQKILHANYKFSCYLSREVRNLIENILVPDPDLRFGLRQITSNTWFKTKYVAPEPIRPGVDIGIDEVSFYSNVLAEMAANKLNPIRISYVKKCLTANRHNALTAYYYLLAKKKTIEGEPLGDEVPADDTGALMPKGSQTKKYQSIEPHRTSLYNEKNKYQLRKIAEGLDTLNINRVRNQPAINTVKIPTQPTNV